MNADATPMGRRYPQSSSHLSAAIGVASAFIGVNAFL
jgi:hypothetical protein